MCFHYSQSYVCGHTSSSTFPERCSRFKSKQSCHTVSRTTHSTQPCPQCTPAIKDYMDSRAGLGTNIGYTSTPGRYQAYDTGRPSQQSGFAPYVASRPAARPFHSVGQSNSGMNIDPELLALDQSAYQQGQAQPNNTPYVSNASARSYNGPPNAPASLRPGFGMPRMAPPSPAPAYTSFNQTYQPTANSGGVASGSDADQSRKGVDYYSSQW